MPDTLNPACPLCGPRFRNKPLLDLHVPEDHRQRVFRAQNGDRDPGSTRAPASGADSPPDPPDPHDPAATPPWTSKKATARPGRRGRSADRAKTALRRALWRSVSCATSTANSGAHQVPSCAWSVHRIPARMLLCPPPGSRGTLNEVPPRNADRGDCPICRASFPL
jgi:hypothetical protein